MKWNSKEQIEKVWKAYFGTNFKVRDPFGREIHRNEHGTNSQFAWEVDHIWPKNPDGIQHGANVWENVQPLASESNREKSNNLQGKLNGVTFAIHKNGTYLGKQIGRLAYKKNEKWFWGYDEPRY